MVSVAPFTSDIRRSTSSTVWLTVAANMSSSSWRLDMGSRRCRSPAAISRQAAWSARTRRSGLRLSEAPSTRPVRMMTTALQARACNTIARISVSCDTSRPTTRISPQGSRLAISRARLGNSAVGGMSIDGPSGMRFGGSRLRLPTKGAPSRLNRA